MLKKIRNFLRYSAKSAVSIDKSIEDYDMNKLEYHKKNTKFSRENPDFLGKFKDRKLISKLLRIGNVCAIKNT